jgi:hypothetical protein
LHKHSKIEKSATALLTNENRLLMIFVGNELLDQEVFKLVDSDRLRDMVLMERTAVKHVR